MLHKSLRFLHSLCITLHRHVLWISVISQLIQVLITAYIPTAWNQWAITRPALMDNGTSGAARRHPITLISLTGPKLSRSPLYAAQFQSSCGNGVARHRGRLRPPILHSRFVDIASRPYWIQRKSKSSARPCSGPICGYVFQLRIRGWVGQTTCSRLFAMDKRSLEHVSSCSRFRLSDVSLH